jgi:ribosomal protein S18 acetylase RimI-like enzyme
MLRSSFDRISLADGAAALNTVFEGYVVPMAFSTEQMELHVLYNDIDLRASPIWYDDAGRVVAAALLGIRGERGWIGGFGVAPEHRRHGYAKELIRTMIETAASRGLARLGLEVLRENEPAFNLYAGAGFKQTRRLHSFETRRENSQMPTGFTAMWRDDFLDAPQSIPPCWQRERSALRNGAVSSAVWHERGTFALFRSNPSRAQVLKLHAQTTQDFTLLADAIANASASQNILILNEPEESSITAFARDAKWDDPFSQYEMSLEVG